jgi:cytochrome c-type biogenesis protein CcmF
LAYFGSQALNVALVFSLYATLLYFISGNNPYSKYMKSANRATITAFALVSAASLALVIALFRRDFQIEYVAEYSNRSLSWFYTLAAFWAGQAGSLLFWCLLLTIFAVVVLAQNRKKNAELLPYTMGIMQATIFFFLYLLVFTSSPFKLLAFLPPDGQGLNPLLQNPEMVFHPPALYIGFVGFTVPFAFAFAALLSGRLDEQWLKTIRRWTLFSWLFLTIGNVLGMQWAYVELGWGGYWAWDPVENSSLMPWLTGTAFLHSIIVQERKGVLKRWTISLIALTFALTIFGTFVTRSGLISSVHAFGVSNLGPLFLGFLALIIISSIILLVKRAPELQGKKDIGSWSSKESGFLLNNLLFVALTLGVLFGILQPSLSELISGQQMTVSAQFFDRMATPIALAIFLLIGVCTAFSWSKTTTKNLVRNLLLPTIITALFLVILILFGVRHFTPLAALAIAVFALSITLQDFLRGVQVYRKKYGQSFLRSTISLTMKHQRRYGGYIVHVGVLCFFLGLIGSSAFSVDKTATLNKGDSMIIGAYNLIYQGIERQQAKDRVIDSAHFEVSKNSRQIGIIDAEKHLFKSFQPSTEVGIRSTLKEDIYVILGDYDLASGLATVNVLINPLVMWIWIGAVIMVLGTMVSMLPNRKNMSV